jgi:ABC-type dipeptide/oligopeptide/nickel transport system permease component
MGSFAGFPPGPHRPSAPAAGGPCGAAVARSAGRLLALYVPTLLLALTLLIALPGLAPGDPLAALQHRAAVAPDARLEAELRAHSGLDRPLPEQRGRLLGGS